jgi:putative ABC transport system substrate-binding protein
VQRREFVALFSGAAAWPLAARAQDAGGVRRIAVLTTFSDKDVLAQGWLAAFRKGLDEFNWRDGRNVRIDYRAGRRTMRTDCEDSHRNWSRCNPTSSLR